jgi:DMSO/TMAO reductase YedYZ heme-binding membrane subunit
MTFILDNLAFILIPFIFMTVVFVGNFLHKHQLIFIPFTLFLAILIYVIQGEFLSLIVLSGHLSLALMMLVIIGGMLPKQSVFRQILQPVRGDLALYSFVFLVPHGLKNISLVLAGYNVTGLIAFIVMLPLYVTSLTIVRNKMPKHLWHQMHKLAYLGYAVLYVHVAFQVWVSPSFILTVKPYAWPFHAFSALYIATKIIPIFMKRYQKKSLQLK